MSIGSRLKQWREYKNLNQDDASSLLGTPFSTLQKYEMNISKPGADAIIRFIDAGINATWLLKGIGPMLIADYSTAQSPAPVAATEPPCPVDITRLTEAIESIEGILTKHKRTMRPDAKARAVTLAYQIFEDEDKEKDSASYNYAQKMMTKLIKTMA